MMTERKDMAVKKKQELRDRSRRMGKFKTKEERNQSKKHRQMMKKRLIVRNLSFQVSEEKLNEIFSEFGEVLEASIPLNKDGRKRGFAFIRYKDTKSQVKAMKALNFKKILGRPIAIDFAVDKTTYQSRQQGQKFASNSLEEEKREIDEEKRKSNFETKDSDDEETMPQIQEFVSDSSSEEDDKSIEDKKVKTFLKEFDADEDLDDDDLDESSDGSSEDEEEDNGEKESHHSNETANTYENYLKEKQKSQDVSEGKTIFIRNVSFKNTQEDLEEIMQEYGETVYCLLCVDPLTDHPKGTAFVKFKEKESAEKLIAKSSKEPGILLDGRKLTCTYAVSREELFKIHSNQSTKVKDKRNLRLLKCGLIIQGSSEAEGVSQADMTKRAQLEIVKKQKLKNVNFFVSDKRLAVHNVPKNFTDKDLYALFRNAVGKEAVIKEARVMRDLKKTDAQGVPVSKGFGFVAFSEHDHALKALNELNNNPNTFTSHKRPIVEFSVENKVALLSQERKREKIKQKNKRRLEEKHSSENAKIEENQQHQESSHQKAFSKKKKRKQKANNSPSKKVKQNFIVEQPSDEIQSPKQSKKKQVKQNSIVKQPSDEILSPKQSKKKQKKKRRKKNKGSASMNTQVSDSLSQLTNKYKERLLNKFP